MQARVYTLSMSSPVRAGTVIQVHVMHYLENKSFPGGRGFRGVVCLGKNFLLRQGRILTLCMRTWSSYIND